MDESTVPSGPSTDDQPFVPDGNPLPARPNAVVIPDDRWYNLKLDYYDTKGNLQSGAAYYVGTGSGWMYWAYISTTYSNGPMAKFKKVKTEGNRMKLETSDGYYLSCRAAPRLWLYRSYSNYAVGWEIVDGKLFTDYHDGPVGAVYYQYGAVPEAYYMRVDQNPAVINCEWVLAPDQES